MMLNFRDILFASLWTLNHLKCPALVSTITSLIGIHQLISGSPSHVYSRLCFHWKYKINLLPNNLVFIQDKCCRLTLCLRMMKKCNTWSLIASYYLFILVSFSFVLHSWPCFLGGGGEPELLRVPRHPQRRVDVRRQTSLPTFVARSASGSKRRRRRGAQVQVRVRSGH